MSDKLQFVARLRQAKACRTSNCIITARAKAQLLLGVFVQDFFEPEMSIQAIVVRLNVEEQH